MPTLTYIRGFLPTVLLIACALYLLFLAPLMSPNGKSGDGDKNKKQSLLWQHSRPTNLDEHGKSKG
jgi:threonine/homoserine/homoserine lactone efflux protein